MHCIRFSLLLGKTLCPKLEISYICSTTTFAFNEHTARLMKRGLKEMFRMITGMPRINRKIKELKAHGYAVDNLISML